MRKLIAFTIILICFCNFVYAKTGIWSNSINISSNNGASGSQSMKIDNLNYIHLVWEDASRLGGITGDILYSFFNGLTWSVPVTISSPSMAYSWDPAIALDSNNKPHVVWEGNAYVNGHTFYTYLDSNLIWSTPLDLLPLTNDNWNPDLAIDPMNNIHVVWKVGLYYLFYRKWDGQQWQAAVNLWPSAVMRGAPKIASDSRGYLHLVWEENAGSTDNMMYSCNDGNGWSDPVIISNVPGEHASDPSICIDDNNYPHVVWKQTLPYIQGEVFYSYYSGSNWSVPINVSNVGGYCFYPVIAISPQFKSIAFLRDEGDPPSHNLIVFNYGLSWSQPDTIMPNNQGTQIALAFNHNYQLQTVIAPIIWLGNSDVVHLCYIDNAILPTILIPHSPPITISPSGGSFYFDASVSNQAVLGAVVDVWFDVRLPNGNIYGPLLNRQNINMAAHSSISRANLTQTIPGWAPAGQYYYRLHAGDYPSLSVSADSFAFTKLGTENGIPVIGNWSLTGWDDESQITKEDLHPSSFILHPCSPNPFNPTTAISYQLSANSFVSLKVYDTAGRLVTNLVDGWREAGSHEVPFDGSRLASGVYLVRLEAGNYTAVQKIVLLK